MKVARIVARVVTWIIILMLALPPAVMAQDSGEASQPPEFTKEQLAQMLAPIALYPDPLISSILMASTYPVEVVEAERWRRQNDNLTDDEIDQALQEKNWDSSVKMLCHFPKVLYAMSDDLERTTRLGDAFLAQQDDVMNMIQKLRRKAEEEGNLRTTSQQKVIVEQSVIQIEPVNPTVIYVPVYDPLYVYGPWWYPAYPPYYWYYPAGGIIATSVIGFGFGIVVGAGISSWCWPDWHHHRIDIDIHRTSSFNSFKRGRWNFNRHVWIHSPVHRRGAAYRFRPTASRFGEPIPSLQRIKPQARGYEGSRQVQPYRGTVQGQEIQRRTTQPYRGNVERREVPRQTTEPYRGTVQRREVPRQKTQPYHGTSQRREAPGTSYHRQGTPGQVSHGNIFQGVGQGSFERRSSERGFQSRQSGRSVAPARSGVRSGSQGGVSHGGSRSGGGRSGGSRR